METMRPDGQDVLYVAVHLRDAFNDTMPYLEQSPSLVGPLELVGDAQRISDYHVLRVRAGTSSGPHTMEVTWQGVRTGVFCDLLLEGELSGRGSSALSELEATLSTLDVTAPDEWSELSWRPRSPSGRLLGSGIAASWDASLGEWQGEVEYLGFGRYRRWLSPGRYGGMAAIGVEGAGIRSGVTLEINGPSPPDAGPRDAGPVTTPDEGLAQSDAGERDASLNSGVLVGGAACSVVHLARPFPVWSLAVALLAVLRRKRST
jgi:hypothetical protein